MFGFTGHQTAATWPNHAKQSCAAKADWPSGEPRKNQRIGLPKRPKSFGLTKAASCVALGIGMLGTGSAGAAEAVQKGAPIGSIAPVERAGLYGDSSRYEAYWLGDWLNDAVVLADGQQAVAQSAAEETAVAITSATASEVQQGSGQGSNQQSAASPDTGDDPDDDPAQLLALFPDGARQSITSMDELDLVLGQRQIFSDLRSLQNRINNTQRPMANAVFRHSSQSDDLDISQLEVSQDLFFARGRTELRVGLQAIDYDPRGVEGVSQYAAGLTGSHRITNAAALNGEFWLNQLRLGDDREVEATYNIFLTLRPSDVVRLDINTSRRLFDNIRSLQLGLSVTSFGGSIDFLPMEDLRLTARGTYGEYEDGNNRVTAEVEGIWRVSGQPTTEIGLRATTFHFRNCSIMAISTPRIIIPAK